MSDMDTVDVNEETLLEVLRNLDADALARVWVDFNIWQWPDDLPDPLKPEWWDRPGIRSKHERQNRKYGFIEAVRPYIEAHTSEDLIQETWENRQVHG